jgi:hypothetical protein
MVADRRTELVEIELSPSVLSSVIESCLTAGDDESRRAGMEMMDSALVRLVEDTSPSG